MNSTLYHLATAAADLIEKYKVSMDDHQAGRPSTLTVNDQFYNNFQSVLDEWKDLEADSEPLSIKYLKDLKW